MNGNMLFSIRRILEPEQSRNQARNIKFAGLQRIVLNKINSFLAMCGARDIFAASWSTCAILAGKQAGNLSMGVETRSSYCSGHVSTLRNPYCGWEP